MAITAASEGHRVWYHWEKLFEERLSVLLRDKRIYCSNPALKEEYCYGSKDLEFFSSACAD